MSYRMASSNDLEGHFCCWKSFQLPYLVKLSASLLTECVAWSLCGSWASCSQRWSRIERTQQLRVPESLLCSSYGTSTVCKDQRQRTSAFRVFAAGDGNARKCADALDACQPVFGLYPWTHVANNLQVLPYLITAYCGPAGVIGIIATAAEARCRADCGRHVTAWLCRIRTICGCGLHLAAPSCSK